MLPPDRAVGLGPMDEVTICLQDQLDPCGISLNRRISPILSPEGIDVDGLGTDARNIPRLTGLTFFERGMRQMGFPFGRITTVT